jgi:hypothetical protein
VDAAVLAQAQRVVVIVDDLQLERDVERVREPAQQIVLETGWFCFGIGEIGIGSGHDRRDEATELDWVDAPGARRIAAAAGDNEARGQPDEEDARAAPPIA